MEEPLNGGTKYYYTRDKDYDRSSRRPNASLLQETCNIELVYKELGTPNWYALTQLGISFLCANLPTYATFSFIFMGFEPDHVCKPIDETEIREHFHLLNDTTTRLSYKSCHISILSNRTGQEKEVASLGCIRGYTYSEGKQVSMATEWDMVCDKRGIFQMVYGAMAMGMMVGCIFPTILCDRIGRRHSMLVTAGIIILGELGFLFAPNIYVAIISRLVSGIGMKGHTTIHQVFRSELVISEWRQIVGSVASLVWAFTLMSLPGVALLLGHVSWRYLQLVIVSQCALGFLLNFLVNETPLWYFDKGRHEKARSVLNKICEFNKKANRDTVLELFNKMVERAMSERKKESVTMNHQNQTEGTYSLMDVIRHKQILGMTLALCFIWFATMLSFSGLYFLSSTLAGNRYLNFFLLAVTEIPGALIQMIAVVYFGRRRVLLVFGAVSGIALAAYTCVMLVNEGWGETDAVIKLFSFIGKLATAVFLNTLITYTPETFPTSLRCSCTGMAIACGSLSGIGAPYLLPLYGTVPWVPGAILSFTCLLAFLMVPLLPETRGRTLPRTIEEVISWKGKRKDVH